MRLISIVLSMLLLQIATRNPDVRLTKHGMKSIPNVTFPPKKRAVSISVSSDVRT